MSQHAALPDACMAEVTIAGMHISRLALSAKRKQLVHVLDAQMTLSTWACGTGNACQAAFFQ